MAIYFLRFDRPFFYEEIVPALAASRARRSFTPCRALCRTLLDQSAASFGDTCFMGPEGPLLARVADGLPFDRDFWRLLVGEVLLFAAADVPRIETAAEMLTCLLAPASYRVGWLPRERQPPIQQVHFGSRDLRFGGVVYRGDGAGLNDAADTERLASYLDTLDPDGWRLADLAPWQETTDDADRMEELEFAREWFPPLRQLYREAAARGQVMVCETP